MLKNWLTAVCACLLVTLMALATRAQTVVYSNQSNVQNFSSGFSPTPVIWDDLQLTGGGRLSEISILAQASSGGSQNVSGYIDLRLFDETFNQPQGEPLGLIPFDDEFDSVPGSFQDRRIDINLTNLDSLGISLPASGRIGAGVFLDGSGWTFAGAGPPEVGASPGGNWLDNSFFERSDSGGDFAWKVSVADAVATGPGFGNYNVFETALATPDHSTSNSGNGVNDDFFTGIGFTVERTTQVSQVGAFLRSGSGNVFAAIVETDSQFAKPDLTGGRVRGTTLLELSPTSPGTDVVGNLELTLEPGSYALVLGSGMFGADGSALLRDSHIPNGSWTEYSLRQSDNEQFFQAGTKRMFVIAESSPGTVQVRPTFDVQAEVINGPLSEDSEVRLIDGDSGIFVSPSFDEEDPDRLAVLEFSLEDVPARRSINSVTLELDPHQFTQSGGEPVSYSILGYGGDGTPQRTDVLLPETIVGAANIDSTGIQSISIDPLFVESLVGQASHLGLTIRAEQSEFFAFGTLEGGEFREAPLLTIGLGPAGDGDFDGDGVVDGNDFLFWQRGQSPNPLSPEDLALWKSNLNASGLSATTLVAVPEPATALLLALAMLFFSRGSHPALQTG